MAEDGAGKLAREAAIREAAGTLAYLAVVGLVSFALLKRDAVTRLWMRVTARPVPPAKAAERRAVAELRREIADWEHGGGPAPRPKGLYE